MWVAAAGQAADRLSNHREVLAGVKRPDEQQVRTLDGLRMARHERAPPLGGGMEHGRVNTLGYRVDPRGRHSAAVDHLLPRRLRGDYHPCRGGDAGRRLGRERLALAAVVAARELGRRPADFVDHRDHGSGEMGSAGVPVDEVDVDIRAGRGGRVAGRSGDQTNER